MSADARLLGRARKGDGAAFRELVEQHQGDVYRLAMGMTGDHQRAEDLCQETFLRLHRSLSGSPSRFRGDARLSSWLHRVAVNLHIDSSRVRWLRAMVLRPEMDGLPGPGDESHSGDVALDVRAALDALSSRQRAVLVLRHYHGLKVREIASELDIAEGTVKALLHQALKRLRQALEDYGSDTRGS
ncbi:RNA polymerase sigma factor [Candidatus Latescibacterota bacterium]